MPSRGHARLDEGGNELWLIEMVLDKMIEPDQTVKYKIKWKNYGPQWNSWQEIEDFASGPECGHIANYERIQAGQLSKCDRRIKCEKDDEKHRLEVIKREEKNAAKREKKKAKREGQATPRSAASQPAGRNAKARYGASSKRSGGRRGGATAATPLAVSTRRMRSTGGSKAGGDEEGREAEKRRREPSVQPDQAEKSNDDPMDEEALPPAKKRARSSDSPDATCDEASASGAQPTEDELAAPPDELADGAPVLIGAPKSGDLPAENEITDMIGAPSVDTDPKNQTDDPVETASSDSTEDSRRDPQDGSADASADDLIDPHPVYSDPKSQPDERVETTSFDSSEDTRSDPADVSRGVESDEMSEGDESSEAQGRVGVSGSRDGVDSPHESDFGGGSGRTNEQSTSAIALADSTGAAAAMASQSGKAEQSISFLGSTALKKFETTTPRQSMIALSPFTPAASRLSIDGEEEEKDREKDAERRMKEENEENMESEPNSDEEDEEGKDEDGKEPVQSEDEEEEIEMEEEKVGAEEEEEESQSEAKEDNEIEEGTDPALSDPEEKEEMENQIGDDYVGDEKEEELNLSEEANEIGEIEEDNEPVFSESEEEGEEENEEEDDMEKGGEDGEKRDEEEGPRESEKEDTAGVDETTMEGDKNEEKADAGVSKEDYLPPSPLVAADSPRQLVIVDPHDDEAVGKEDFPGPSFPLVPDSSRQQIGLIEYPDNDEADGKVSFPAPAFPVAVDPVVDPEEDDDEDIDVVGFDDDEDTTADFSYLLLAAAQAVTNEDAALPAIRSPRDSLSTLDSPPFDWENNLDGGTLAPAKCFWKRSVGRFVNRYEGLEDQLLIAPHFGETYREKYVTLAVCSVVGTHGPWVGVRAIDGKDRHVSWYMSDDPVLWFLNEDLRKKTSEPTDRVLTDNYKRRVDREMSKHPNVPESCFENQLPVDSRPKKNYFEVGNKLEAYAECGGDGSFWPATVVGVQGGTVVIRFDRTAAAAHRKTLRYDDLRLFPCGFAAAIGWKCAFPTTEEPAPLKEKVNQGPSLQKSNDAPIDVTPSADRDGNNTADLSMGAPSTSTESREEKKILQENPSGKKRGRPLGSKNKPKKAREDKDDAAIFDEKTEKLKDNSEKLKDKSLVPQSRKKKVKRPAKIPSDIANSSRVKEDRERPVKISSDLTCGSDMNGDGKRPTKKRARKAYKKRDLLYFYPACDWGPYFDSSRCRNSERKFVCNSNQKKIENVLLTLLNSLITTLVECSTDLEKLMEIFHPYEVDSQSSSAIPFVVASRTIFLPPPTDSRIISKMINSVFTDMGMCPSAIGFGSRLKCSKCRPIGPSPKATSQPQSEITLNHALDDHVYPSMMGGKSSAPARHLLASTPSLPSLPRRSSAIDAIYRPNLLSDFKLVSNLGLLGRKRPFFANRQAPTTAPLPTAPPPPSPLPPSLPTAPSPVIAATATATIGVGAAIQIPVPATPVAQQSLPQ